MYIYMCIQKDNLHAQEPINKLAILKHALKFCYPVKLHSCHQLFLNCVLREKWRRNQIPTW